MSRLAYLQDQQVLVHYQAALKVARILDQHHFDAYLIGGAVRDLWLGYWPQDFDLVTNAHPDQIIALPELEQARYHDPAQAFGVTRVKVTVNYRQQQFTSEVEVATYRRDLEAHLGRKLTKVAYAELADDVARRDFTINALALDLSADYLVDLVGGIADLEAGLVRLIGDPVQRLAEDPLRLLRGLRFKVQYDFTYETQTQQALQQAITQGMVEQIARARLRDELTRLLTHPTRALALQELERFGLIKQLLPELKAAQTTPQPPQLHAEGNVWRHSLLAIGYLRGVVSPRLAWATLLHDIGKPPTYQPASATGDRIRFSEHYKVGAELAGKILGRLGFGRRLIADVQWLINYHLAIDNLPQMRPGRARHFMSHPAFKDLLRLHVADAKASWQLSQTGEVLKPKPEFAQLKALWQQFQAEAHSPLPSLKVDLGIDGHWLQREFKLEGEKLGVILEQLNDAYLDGKLTSEADSRRLVKNYLST